VPAALVTLPRVLRLVATAFVLLALTGGCRRHRVVHANRSIAVELRDRALTGSKAFEHVRDLATVVGPRLAGSEGDRRAVDWAVAKMRAIDLAAVRAESVTVPHWERGVERATLDGRPLAITALGGSVATPPGGVEAEVVVAESLEALDAVPDDAIRGRIVFFDKPMVRAVDGSGYEAAVDVRARGAIAAARKGAVASVIRSIGTGGGRAPHTGGLRYDDAVPKIPAAALAIPDAAFLREALAATPGLRLRLELGCRTLPDATSANVIGEIRGRARPDEIVLLGAHLDSWDLGRGAVDDGAGVAVVLEVGRMLRERGLTPRRTIRIVLFANEENGLRGARAYAAAHARELDAHVLGLELDLGSGPVHAIHALAGPDSIPALRAIAAPLAALGIAPVDERPIHGADLWPLRAAGVPVVDLDQDATRYFDVHLTADDTLAAIDPRELDQVTAATVAFVWNAAESRVTFGRIPADARR
jgi:hypothetical protein